MKLAKRRKNLLLRFALLAIFIYVVVAFIQLRLQLGDGQQRLDDLRKQLTVQQNTNSELKERIESYADYLEQQARKQGMAKPGETILVEVPEE